MDRAFSPYHQGPILGPIPNPKYLCLSQFPKKKSQSEGKKISMGSEFNDKKLQNCSLSRVITDLDSISELLCAIYTEMSSVLMVRNVPQK